MPLPWRICTVPATPAPHTEIVIFGGSSPTGSVTRIATLSPTAWPLTGTRRAERPDLWASRSPTWSSLRAMEAPTSGSRVVPPMRATSTAPSSSLTTCSARNTPVSTVRPDRLDGPPRSKCAPPTGCVSSLSPGGQLLRQQLPGRMWSGGRSRSIGRTSEVLITSGPPSGRRTTPKRRMASPGPRGSRTGRSC